MALKPDRKALAFDLTRAENIKRNAQKQFDLSFMHAGTIDEVSLLYPNRETLELFVEYAQEAGWDHFNHTEDVCCRDDVDREAFQVRFDFLQPPTKPDWPWRIEAMCVLDGHAPLHEAALEASGGRSVTIHASYKLADEAAYMADLDTQVRRFAGAGGCRAQYSNSYGRFAYFGIEPFYFKPRVNLRDV